MNTIFKLTITALIIAFTSLSCTTADNEGFPTYHEGMKLYKDNTAYINDNNNEQIRFYFDDKSSIITRYASHHATNQSDSSEEFGVHQTQFFENHNNTNIDYTVYIINSYHNSSVSFDVKNAPHVIILSHDANTDQYLFKYFQNESDISLSNDSPNGEYYKIITQ